VERIQGTSQKPHLESCNSLEEENLEATDPSSSRVTWPSRPEQKRRDTFL
jgi:hypothetical protein